ncbi:hypothetical protein HN51_053386 [Arachis hypogaea]
MGSNRNLATRALETDMPVMVRMQKLLRGAKNCVSLAQGVVYWKPPEEALEKVQKLVFEPSISRYGGDDGLPELRAALIKKLRDENNLHKSSVMVTAGANQVITSQKYKCVL